MILGRLDNMPVLKVLTLEVNIRFPPFYPRNALLSRIHKRKSFAMMVARTSALPNHFVQRQQLSKQSSKLLTPTTPDAHHFHHVVVANIDTWMVNSILP